MTSTIFILFVWVIGEPVHSHEFNSQEACAAAMSAIHKEASASPVTKPYRPRMVCVPKGGEPS